MEQCSEHAQLETAVLAILKKIEGIVMEQICSFQEDDHARFNALDKALELAVGEKERSIGALRQHEIDHRCQGA